MVLVELGDFAERLLYMYWHVDDRVVEPYIILEPIGARNHLLIAVLVWGEFDDVFLWLVFILNTLHS